MTRIEEVVSDDMDEDLTIFPAGYRVVCGKAHHEMSKYQVRGEGAFRKRRCSIGARFSTRIDVIACSQRRRG